jgi:hypothetical protein
LLGLGAAAPVLDTRSTCPTPTVNAATITLIQGYEKFSPAPYKDANGDWTVGWGHLCNQDKKCTEVSYPIPLSDVYLSYILPNYYYANRYQQADGLTLFNKDLSVSLP